MAAIAPDRLEALRAMSYEEYRQTPEWESTRKKTLKRDSVCQACKANQRLNVYHYNFERIGREEDTDLLILCVDCYENIRAAANIPTLTFGQKAGVFIGTAVVSTIGLEGFLNAPLPAEVGALIGAYYLAKNSPTVYAALKKRLPPEMMRWLGLSQAPKERKRSRFGHWFRGPQTQEASSLPTDEEVEAELARMHEAEEENSLNEDGTSSHTVLSFEHVHSLYRAHKINDAQFLTLLDQLPASADQPPVEAEQSTEVLGNLVDEGNYPDLPPLHIFEALSSTQAITKDAIHSMEQLINDILNGFHVLAEVRPEATMIGPRVIRFGIAPTGKPVMVNGAPKKDESGRIVYASRTRVEQITKCEKDIQLALSAESIRMMPPVPGKNYVGVEIPNPCAVKVSLPDVLGSAEYQSARNASKLVFALGQDVAGQVRYCDIAKAPHLLIAGATGSGKSVLLNVLLASILTQATPEDVRLLMIDPKMVELTPYNGIPHLLRSVVTDPDQAVPLLENAVSEMERRYQILSKVGVRNLEGYRKQRETNPALPNLPSIVIIIDELADLMMTAAEEMEEHICRLAQKARAIGIHLIVATQRPSVDVITGLIKANIPARIAFMVSSATDSRTIIDKGGAERLLGKGDMLYLPSDVSNPIRIQGAFMTDQDATNLANYWRRGDLARTHEYWEDEPNTELRPPFPPLRSGEDRDEAYYYGRNGYQENTPVGLEFDHYDPYDVTRNARKGASELALEEAVSPQSGAVTAVPLPPGWTEENLALLPGFYRVFGSLDKCLEACDLSTSQRNRDFARDVLRKQGLWKEK